MHSHVAQTILQQLCTEVGSPSVGIVVDSRSKNAQGLCTAAITYIYPRQLA